MPFYTVLTLLNNFLCSVVTIETPKLLQDIFMWKISTKKNNKELELYKILNLLNKLKKNFEKFREDFFLQNFLLNTTTKSQ